MSGCAKSRRTHHNSRACSGHIGACGIETNCCSTGSPCSFRSCGNVPDVDPLLAGGASCLLRWYPRLGLRPVPQLDLIVEREKAAEAVKISTYAGWRVAGQTRASTFLRDESRRVLVIHSGAPPQIAGPLGDRALSVLREHAVELGDTEATPLVLDAADELLYACAIGRANIACADVSMARRRVPRSPAQPEAPTAEALLERARLPPSRRKRSRDRAVPRRSCRRRSPAPVRHGVRRRTDRTEGQDCVRAGRCG